MRSCQSTHQQPISGNGSAESLRAFEIVKTIGEGTFAKVYKVINRYDGISYAMKRCKIGQMKAKDKDNALNEVKILASIAHPNVIAYKEAIYDDSSQCLYIIMEYAAGGDLLQQVKQCQRNQSSLEENEIWKWTFQMIRGLQALHDKKIIHRDIKCANIFLDSHRSVKIGDLNVSKFTEANFAKTQVGTPYYTAPEVWNEQPYNHKSDIWSLGCLIYELCTHQPPFLAQNIAQLFKKIINGSYNRIPQRYSSELSGFIGQCLTVNQAVRLDCDQLLNHPSMRRKVQEMNLEKSVVEAAPRYIKRSTTPTPQPSSQLNIQLNLISERTKIQQEKTPRSININGNTLLRRASISTPIEQQVEKTPRSQNNSQGNIITRRQSIASIVELQTEITSNAKGFTPSRRASIASLVEQQSIVAQATDNNQRRIRSTTGVPSVKSNHVNAINYEVLLEEEIQRRISCLNKQNEDQTKTKRNISEDAFAQIPRKNVSICSSQPQLDKHRSSRIMSSDKPLLQRCEENISNQCAVNNVYQMKQPILLQKHNAYVAGSFHYKPLQQSQKRTSNAIVKTSTILNLQSAFGSRRESVYSPSQHAKAVVKENSKPFRSCLFI